MATANGTQGCPRPRRYSTDWWWDIAMKALIPIAIALGTVLMTHEASILDNSKRIQLLERSINERNTTFEAILSTLTGIQVQIGRLEERVAAAVDRMNRNGK